MIKNGWKILISLLILFTNGIGAAQTPPGKGDQLSTPGGRSCLNPDQEGPNKDELLQLMMHKIAQLESRLARLESTSQAAATHQVLLPITPPKEISAPPVSTGSQRREQDLKLSTEDESRLTRLLDGATLNLMVDGYYSYNLNRPSGGINLLRAYDVTSNSFNLNQVTMVLEHAPNLAEGRRIGGRLDLQHGQATETVQGNPVNEPRPQVYRHIWQAYGTYIAPIGKGLTVDFGKFAGALGYETNFTKDNFNYSRAYFFNYLPFYHFGFRSSYELNSKVTLTHWLVNGANQTEDFNGFKSQAVLLTWRPSKRISVQTNYYVGREQQHRSVSSLSDARVPIYLLQKSILNGADQSAPTGRFHVLDTYATFNVTERLTLALEGVYSIKRIESDSAPARVTGGVAYARYQLRPGLAFAGRFEYLSDRGGLFSGVTQALKEKTLTIERKFADGFMIRGEYRRDYSNNPYFLTARPGVLKKEQNSVTLGLIWWFGPKKGVW